MKLPDKPSELIMVALKDLNACDRSRTYTVDMKTWHSYDIGSNTCVVCLAGSVMAQTLKVANDRSTSPDFFPTEIDDKLNALNDFRQGYVSLGLYSMGLRSEQDPAFVHITSFEEDKEKFFMDMTDMANRLAQVGL